MGKGVGESVTAHGPGCCQIIRVVKRKHMLYNRERVTTSMLNIGEEWWYQKARVWTKLCDISSKFF